MGSCIGVKRSGETENSFVAELIYQGEYAHINKKDGEKTVWRDKVVLVKENGRWAIDDVVFTADWVREKVSLKGILLDVIKS